MFTVSLYSGGCIEFGIEKDFYKHSNGCYIDRCKILFNDQISYEPANALVVVE